MIYEEIAPSLRLADVVSSYWRFALPASHTPSAMLHTVPPDGTVNLCWLPPGRAVILGPRVTVLRVPVQSACEYIGVRFLPGVAGPLLGIDVRTIRDKVLPLSDDHEFSVSVKNSGIDGLNALVERWVLRDDWEGPDPVVTEIARRIILCDGALPITALVSGLNLSYRQILRRFYKSSGLTPKEFARVRRLRAVCVDAVQSAQPLWAGVSTSAGFSDQSHLAREFRDVYGWPPRLVHEYLRQIEHRNLIE